MCDGPIVKHTSKASKEMKMSSSFHWAIYHIFSQAGASQLGNDMWMTEQVLLFGLAPNGLARTLPWKTTYYLSGTLLIQDLTNKHPPFCKTLKQDGKITGGPFVHILKKGKSV